MDRELLTALKALSDASRLRIVGLLAARPYAVEELAAALQLTPGTIVHHLKILRSAGLAEARSERPYMEYSLRVSALQAIGRQLHELERGAEDGAELPGPEGESMPAYDAKVLRAFIVDGRLASIPAQEKKRQVVLRYLLARCFPEDREYPEKEVNQRLGVFHRDSASLRRHLVDSGLMTRASGIYRRAAALPSPVPSGQVDSEPASSS